MEGKVPGVRMRVSVALSAVVASPERLSSRSEFVRAGEHALTKRRDGARINLFFVAVAPLGEVARDVITTAGEHLISAVKRSLDGGDLAGWIDDRAIAVLLASEHDGASTAFQSRVWQCLADDASRAEDRPAVEVVAVHIVARKTAGILDELVDEGFTLVTDRRPSFSDAFQSPDAP